jgi:hypothetical protein
MNRIVALLTLAMLPAIGEPAITPIEWGPAVEGLQMAISPNGVSRRNSPMFEITIRNAGRLDVWLLLGMTVGTSFQTPDRLVLSGVDAQDKVHVFQFIDFRYGGIAGGMGDFVVPLRSNATYSLTVSLDEFWLPDMTTSAMQELQGKSRITVYLRSQSRRPSGPDKQRQPAAYMWLNDLQSNTLEIGD